MYMFGTAIILSFFFIIWIACLWWIYKDTKKRGGNTALWIILTLFLGFIPLIIWFFIRPSINNLTTNKSTNSKKYKKEDLENSTNEKMTIIDTKNYHIKETDEFTERIEKLLQKNKNLNLSEALSLQDHPDASQRKKAITILEKIENEYEDFIQIQEGIRDIKNKTKKLTDRLADGELDSDSYKRALDDLEKSLMLKEEKLWMLKNKLFNESDYEKPF